MITVNCHNVERTVIHPIRRVDSKSHDNGCFFTRSVEFVRKGTDSIEVVTYADTYAALVLPGDVVYDTVKTQEGIAFINACSISDRNAKLPPPEPMPQGDVI